MGDRGNQSHHRGNAQGRSSRLYHRLNVIRSGYRCCERRDDIDYWQRNLREANRRLGRFSDLMSRGVGGALRIMTGCQRQEPERLRAAVISTGMSNSEDGHGVKARIFVLSPAEVARFHTNSRLRTGSPMMGKIYFAHFEQLMGVEGPKGAARILGLNPSTLRSRMQKLGIRRPFRSKAEVQEG
jgi:transcriptional regulator with GAF, ATPase, and Fis domain